MASWYEDLARSLDLQPADVATAFAGVRASVPVYAGLYAGDTNAGHDEELLKRRGPLPPPALPAPTEDEQQRRMIEDFERQFPTPEIRAAAIKHMLAARSGKVYDPSTATRRVDFERQNASGYSGPEMRATPPVAKRGYQKGGGVRKAMQQVVEQATKGAKSTAKAPRQVPGGALSSSLDVEKLAKALGININEVPNVLPQRESTKNLRKFVGPSAVQHRVYHGSNVPEGIVDDAQFAHYEPDQSDIHWLATDPDFADQYTAKYMEYPGEQGAIFPAHIQLRNPLEVPFDMNKRITPEVWKFAEDLGFSRSDFKEWLLENDIEKPKQAWRIIDSPQFRDAAMERGYDGIRALEAGSETFGVFDRNRIKSQFNEGAYDTGTPDIGKKEGGAVAPTRGYQKGGGVKKTVQQMADELLLKGAKVADKPNLSRRSFFGLRAQPPADFPLARLDDKALARLEQQYGGEGRAPAFTERTTTVSPDAGATRSITETPMSRRGLLSAAAGQVLRHALPGVGDVVPGVGDVAKIVESVATPGLAATKANIPGLVAMAMKQGMNADEVVAFVTSQFRKPPKFGGIMAQGEDPAEYFAQHIEDLHNRFEEPFVNYSPDITGAVRPGKAFQEMIGREDERIKPLALKPVMRGLQQADPDKYRELIRAAKDRSMASVETLLSYPDIDPDVVQRYMRGELRSLPPSYRDKLGYDEYAGGGGVRKTLQQMVDSLLHKGVQTADKPDLARRSLFGLKAQPALDLPLARIDDIEKSLGKGMDKDLAKAPTVSEKSVVVNPATGSVKSALRSITETPMSRRSVLQAAVGQALRRALPGVGDVVPGVGDLAQAAESVAPTFTFDMVPALIAEAVRKGMSEEQAMDFVRSMMPKAPERFRIDDMFQAYKDPEVFTALDNKAGPGEVMRGMMGALPESLTGAPLSSIRPRIRAMRERAPEVYEGLRQTAKDIGEYGHEKSITETPMSRRSVLQAAVGQALRRALPGVGDVVPTPDILGEIAKIVDVAKPAQAAAASAFTNPIAIIMRMRKSGASEEEIGKALGLTNPAEFGSAPKSTQIPKSQEEIDASKEFMFRNPEARAALEKASDGDIMKFAQLVQNKPDALPPDWLMERFLRNGELEERMRVWLNTKGEYTALEKEVPKDSALPVDRNRATSEWQNFQNMYDDVDRPANYLRGTPPLLKTPSRALQEITGLGTDTDAPLMSVRGDLRQLRAADSEQYETMKNAARDVSMDSAETARAMGLPADRIEKLLKGEITTDDLPRWYVNHRDFE